MGINFAEGWVVHFDKNDWYTLMRIYSIGQTRLLLQSMRTGRYINNCDRYGSNRKTVVIVENGKVYNCDKYGSKQISFDLIAGGYLQSELAFVLSRVGIY